MLANQMLLAVIGAAVVSAQGEGLGYPPPAVQTLTHTMSGVLPVLPTPFSGVETEEGAIVYDGPMDPSFMPINGPATTATGLPAATYVATLPSTNFDNGTGSTVTGSIMISSTSGDSGVQVSVNFAGFSSESQYGPFVYHVHAIAVPADGNCTSTTGHLDPTDRGEYYPCNFAAPDTCQVGDLAGKHGNTTGTTFVITYTDEFLSTDPSSPAFFGDKSVVIHTSNTTRITCANFVMMNSSSTSSSGSNSTTSGSGSGSNSTASSGSSGSSSGSSSSTSTPSSMPYTGDAAKLSGFGILSCLGLVSALLL